MMRAFSFILILTAMYCSLFGCANRGVIKDTSHDTQEQNSTADSETAPHDSMTESETMLQTLPETADSATQSEAENTVDTDTATEDTLFADFFGKTREQIIEARGNGDASVDDDDTSLHYSDRYAGFSGSSRYSFDEKGDLGLITLSFDEGFTLREIAEAVTKLNAEAVTLNGETTWTEGDYVYRLTSENDRPVLLIQKEGSAAMQ